MASASFDPYYKWLGIPPDEQPPNHYRLLGIPLYESDLDVIENAAHRQMVYIRTFQTGKNADLSQKLLNELAAAKVCLMSRSKRAAYDESLRRQLQGDAGESGADADTGYESPSGIGGFDSQISGETAGSQESVGAGGESSWSGAESGQMLDFSRPATERRDRTRGKKPGKSTKPSKRGKQPIVAILLLFGGLGVVAVFLIVLLLVLMFRKPKDGNGATQASGKGTVSPETVPSTVGAGTGGFGAGAFAKPGGVGQTGPATTGGDGSGAGPSALSPDGSKTASGRTSATSGTGKGVKGSKPDPNVPSVAGTPETGASSPETRRLERIRGQFDAARQALVARDPNRAEAALTGLGSLNRDPELRVEKERLEAISRFVGEFWKSVRQGSNKVRERLYATRVSPKADSSPPGAAKPTNLNGKSGDRKSSDGKSDSGKSGDGDSRTPADTLGSDGESQAAQDATEKKAIGKKANGKDAAEQDPSGKMESEKATKVESGTLEFLGEVFGLPAEGERGDFTLNGEAWRAPLFDLPPKAAVALALVGMGDSDGFGRFYAATFLLIDEMGDVAENRELGMALYRQAEMLTGEPNAFIIKEFGLEDEQLSAAAEKFPPEKLKARLRPAGEQGPDDARESTSPKRSASKSQEDAPPSNKPDDKPDDKPDNKSDDKPDDKSDDNAAAGSLDRPARRNF